MKLKNFLKNKNKSRPRDKRSYISNTKVNKKPSRAEEKVKNKNKRRTLLFGTIAIVVFAVAVVLFGISQIYSQFILEKLQGEKIVSPSVRSVVQLDEGRKILVGRKISVDTLEHSTESGSLTLLQRKGRRFSSQREKTLSLR